MATERVTTVLLVEDEPEFRRRFERIIQGEASLRLVGSAASLREAQTLIDRMAFDVLIIDLGLPDGSGIDLIRQVSQQRPDVDIMVVSVFGDEHHVLASIEAGATGYVLKDSSPDDVISCIELLRSGGSPVSPLIARSVLKALRQRNGGALPAEVSDTIGEAAGGAARAGIDDNPLSSREAEILQLLAKGMSFYEIGDILGISPHTVTAHVKKLYRKLAVHSRSEAVYEATQLGLL